MKEVVIGDNPLYPINKLVYRETIVKKVLLVSSLAVLTLSQGLLAMFQDKDIEIVDKQPVKQLSQKTEFDIFCEEKFEKEQERLKKVDVRVEKRLGLDKQKKKNSKHFK